MTVTKLEDFIQEGMTHNEVAQDLNDLYKVINTNATVQSHDYRCYVTLKRELMIVFLVHDININSAELIHTIEENTVIYSHGLENIQVVLDKNDFNAQVEDSKISDKVDDLEGFNLPLSDFSIHQSEISTEKLGYYPEYKHIIHNILLIERLDQSSVLGLLSYLGHNNDTNEHKATMTEKYLILNTIEIFTTDITDTKESETIREALIDIKSYFYPEDDDAESIASSKEREIITTLQYLLGSNPAPFRQNTTTIRGKEISIKFYLLLGMIYHTYVQQRKVEQTKLLRRNSKRNIKYIHEILSGNRDIRKTSSLIEYLTQQNPDFDHKHMTHKDISLLEDLIVLLENKQVYYYHNLARMINLMLGEKRRTLNRFFGLLGFNSIGNDTKV